MTSEDARIRRSGAGYVFHDMDIRTVLEAVRQKRREALRFLASPAGERWRRRMAWLLVVALPLSFRIPVLRKDWAV